MKQLSEKDFQKAIANFKIKIQLLQDIRRDEAHRFLLLTARTGNKLHLGPSKMKAIAQ